MILWIFVGFWGASSDIPAQEGFWFPVRGLSRFFVFVSKCEAVRGRAEDRVRGSGQKTDRVGNSGQNQIGPEIRVGNSGQKFPLKFAGILFCEMGKPLSRKIHEKGQGSYRVCVPMPIVNRLALGN